MGVLSAELFIVGVAARKRTRLMILTRSRCVPLLDIDKAGGADQYNFFYVKAS
jgi:hypothetical protein